jgi:hypothetical protein
MVKKTVNYDCQGDERRLRNSKEDLEERRYRSSDSPERKYRETDFDERSVW